MAITDDKFVLLTTFRKNGDAVPTPVWLAALPGGGAGFTTEEASGKVKRIRNNSQVTLQPCSMRGSVKQGSEVLTATAEVLVGAEAAPVGAAIRRKHPVVTSMFKVSALLRKLRRKPEPAECAIRITLS